MKRILLSLFLSGTVLMLSACGSCYSGYYSMPGSSCKGSGSCDSCGYSDDWF